VEHIQEKKSEERGTCILRDRCHTTSSVKALEKTVIAINI